MAAQTEPPASAGRGVAGTSLYLLPFTLLALFVVSRIRIWWRLREFKGPWIASISSMWMAKAAISGRMFEIYTKINKEYGDLARIGSNDLLCSDPEIIKYMSSARPNWHRSEWYDSMSLDPYCDTVFTLKEPVKHDMYRSKLISGYAGKENPTLESDVDKQVASFISYIETKYISTPSLPQLLNFGKAAQYFTLDVITSISYGFPFGYLEQDRDVHDYIATTESYVPILVLGASYPLVHKVLSTPWVCRIVGPLPEDKVGMGKLMGVARKVVGERYGPNAKDRKDMLGSFVRHGLSQREAESEVLLQIIAGSDTTATAIRATLFYLLTTPVALLKFRTEMDQAIKDGRISSPISNAEAKKLPYLQAVIREGLRMHPPFIGILAKEVPPQGEVIKGRFVPGGTKIGHSIWLAQRSEAVYGKDVDVFRPERWIEETDKRRQRVMEDTVQLCFGHGRWGCLGKGIAFMELNKVFVELFRVFDFAIVNPARPWKADNYNLWMIDNMWLRVQYREDGSI